MDWQKELKHYQVNVIDNVKDEELLEEAIATCESCFKNMYEDEELKYKLLNRSRPLVISYLALKYQQRKGNAINKDDIIINSIVPTYITKQFVGEEPPEIIISKLDVEFTYNGTKISTPIVTNRINIEEIKDKIIEVLQ